MFPHYISFLRIGKTKAERPETSTPPSNEAAPVSGEERWSDIQYKVISFGTELIAGFEAIQLRLPSVRDGRFEKAKRQEYFTKSSTSV